MHVVMEPTLPGPRGLAGWLLVRVASPLALWLGRRRWGTSRGVWFIEPNLPLPFLLGWLTKVGIMKLAGGRVLRHARHFFVALILVEAFMGGVSTIVRTISGGDVPGF